MSRVLASEWFGARTKGDGFDWEGRSYEFRRVVWEHADPRFFGVVARRLDQREGELPFVALHVGRSATFDVETLTPQ